jgi:hypothetical protein
MPRAAAVILESLYIAERNIFKPPATALPARHNLEKHEAAARCNTQATKKLLHTQPKSSTKKLRLAPAPTRPWSSGRTTVHLFIILRSSSFGFVPNSCILFLLESHY